MPRSPKHISDSLKLVIRDMGFEKKLDQVRALELWPEVVGENIAKIAKAERVDEGILYIKVTSMTWRTELLFQKQSILEKISARLGKGIIKDIRFF
jgi:predicted nucleic acid-binding Zn ribbon protein